MSGLIKHDHVLLVCGHARPDACENVYTHISTDPTHPCGPSDVADLEMDEQDQSILRGTKHKHHHDGGVMLVWGTEKLKYIPPFQVAYEVNKGAFLLPFGSTFCTW
jgi:hypothetical protein